MATEMGKQTEVVDEGKKRHRSPNYPAVGLPEAIERVKKLIDKNGKAGVQPKSAAVHIGFSTAHGQAYSVLSALKKFGLVKETDGRVSATQRALEVVHLQPNDPRRIQALQEAALDPPIYRQIIEQHKETGLPADDALKADLVTYQGFNPNSVDGFLKDFRATLEFAGLTDISGLHLGEDVGTSTGLDVEPLRTTTREIQKRTGDTGGDWRSSFKPISSTHVRRYQLDISIPRDVRAEIVIAGELQKEDVERLRKQVARILESIEEAFED